MPSARHGADGCHGLRLAAVSAACRPAQQPTKKAGRWKRPPSPLDASHADALAAPRAARAVGERVRQRRKEAHVDGIGHERRERHARRQPLQQPSARWEANVQEKKDGDCPRGERERHARDACWRRECGRDPVSRSGDYRYNVAGVLPDVGHHEVVGARDSPEHEGVDVDKQVERIEARQAAHKKGAQRELLACCARAAAAREIKSVSRVTEHEAESGERIEDFKGKLRHKVEADHLFPERRQVKEHDQDGGDRAQAVDRRRVETSWRAVKRRPHRRRCGWLRLGGHAQWAVG
eukprot:4826076-Prymnesium_polylepis.1